MAVFSTLWIDNDMILRLTLKDHNAVFINDATVTLHTLEDTVGNTVSGITTPLAMSYIAASNGRYEATVPKEVVVVVGTRYDATIRAVTPGGTDAEWVERMVCATQFS